MIRLLFSLILAASVFVFAEPDRPKLVVAVPLAPYAKIVRAIAGENVEVITLVPSNANPHAFEPKPAILKKFSRAVLYFSDESGLDKAWKPRFLSANPNVQVVDLSEGISWIGQESHHHHEREEGEEHADELDPHLWNSPRQVVLIASNVCKALAEKDAMHAGAFRANLETFNRKMSALDRKFVDMTKSLPAERRTFVVFHPSYGYLARDYGLKQIAVEMDGKEPKPRDMANLVRVAKENHASAVFVQPQFSKRSAQSLSKEIGAAVVSVDPLAYDFDENLIRLMDAIVGEPKK